MSYHDYFVIFIGNLFYQCSYECDLYILSNNLYNKTRHSYLYVLPIAGQTTGPIGLKFFVDTQEWPGGVIG